MTNRTEPETPTGGPMGDTGDGDTGVPEFEQGISNRPGDRASASGTSVDVEDSDDEVDLEDQEGDFDGEPEVTEDDDPASGL